MSGCIRYCMLLAASVNGYAGMFQASPQEVHGIWPLPLQSHKQGLIISKAACLPHNHKYGIEKNKP